MKRSRSSFYVPGGTLAGDAPSYVMRDADLDLYAALRDGEFCYVLASGQMGKSSLMVRTLARLRQEGFAALVIDLTAVGQNLTAGQWYLGLMRRIGSELGLEQELEDHWNPDASLGPLQRWMGCIREVVLPRTSAPVVIFIDEIDAMRHLPFPADEFFAGIREFYNERAENPELERLTFCLLGVATPSDLMRDVGKRIELPDFSERETLVLLPGLSRAGRVAPALLRRILYWTGGHPYLTQRFCQAVSEDPRARSNAGVNRVCKEIFLSAHAREHDENLLSARERMLHGGADPAAILTVYSDLIAGKLIKDDPENPVVTQLRVAGVVRVEGGYLRIRNRIYERVFNQAFVNANQPVDERERQRSAEWRGRIRVLRWAVPTMLALACLAIIAWWQTERAQQLSATLETNAKYGMETSSALANELYAASGKQPELYDEYVKVVEASKQYASAVLSVDPRDISAINLKAHAGYVAAEEAAEHGEKAQARKLSEESAADAKVMATDSDIRLRAIAARTFAAVAHTLGRLGDTASAEAYAQKAEAVAGAVSKQIKPDDEFTVQTVAATYDLLGSAEQSMDHWERAVKLQGRGGGAQQQVLNPDPKAGDSNQALFQNAHDALEERNRIGRIELESNQPEAARQVLEERSLRIAGALLEWNENPSQHRTGEQKIQARLDLLKVEDMLGHVLASKKETWVEALKYYGDAVDTAEKLVKADDSPANREKLEDEVASLARVRTLLGMTRDALPSYVRYVALVRERVTAQPSPKNSFKLGEAYRGLADFELHHGDKGAAPSDYETALEWLGKADAKDSATEQAIAAISGKLADLESESGRPEAKEHYREMARASEKSIALARGHDAARDAYAGQPTIMFGYESLAFGRLGLGDSKGAGEAFGKSLEAANAAVKIAKESVNKQRTWDATERAAAAYGNLGWVELLNHHLPESIRASQAALQLDDKPAWISANLAHAFLLSNQADQAKALYLAHRGEEMYDDLFEVSVADDFAELRKLGFDRPIMGEIERLLGK
jgi:hypothetical protein